MNKRLQPYRWNFSASIALLILMFFAFMIPGNAQTNIYMELIKEGDIQYKANNFIKAFELFIKAKEKAVNTAQSNTAEARAEQGRKAITQQQADLQKALEETQRALTKAEKLQRKAELAVFNNEMIAQCSDWYILVDNHESSYAKEKLEKVEKLNLANNGLTRIPVDVLKCPNVKWLDLKGNPDINWKESEPVLKKLPSNTKMSVTVDNLTDIDSAFWPLITELELSDQTNLLIQECVFQQKQLTSLKINRKNVKYGEGFMNLEGIFSLSNLEGLDLDNCNIRKLPDGIGNLRILKSLSLKNNYLNTLPSEIGRLNNLEELDLSGNPLQWLPKEIGNLALLSSMKLDRTKYWESKDKVAHEEYPSGNPKIHFPNEMENLKALKTLSLTGAEEKLPEWTFKLPQLDSFNIGNTRIKEVPDELFTARLAAPCFNDASWYISLGYKLVRNGNYPQSLNAVRKAFKIDKDYNHWKFNSDIGRIYQYNEMIDSAIIFYKRGCTEPNELQSCVAKSLHDGYSELMADYFSVGKFQEAYLYSKVLFAADTIDYDIVTPNLHCKYCLYAGKPLEAIEAAKKEIQLLEGEMPEMELIGTDWKVNVITPLYDCLNPRLYLYLALGYLFSDQREQAEHTQRFWIENSCISMEEFKSNPQQLLGIYQELDEAGITHPGLDTLMDMVLEYFTTGGLDDYKY